MNTVTESEPEAYVPRHDIAAIPPTFTALAPAINARLMLCAQIWRNRVRLGGLPRVGQHRAPSWVEASR